MEEPRKRRTAYSSGRRELAGLVSLKGALRPDGNKTSRKVGKKHKRKLKLGYYDNSRTPLKPKFWKKA